jgi:hypothetical protein
MVLKGAGGGRGKKAEELEAQGEDGRGEDSEK